MSRQEPLRVGLHVDVDCRPGQQESVSGWMLTALVGMAGRIFGTDWESGCTWGWASQGLSGEVSGADDDRAARERFSEMAAHGAISNSLRVHRVQRRQVSLVDLVVSSLPGFPERVEVWLAWTASPGLSTSVKDDMADLMHTLLAEVPEDWDVLFGGVSDDGTAVDVALDLATNVNGHVARSESGEFLRSYSWSTRIPERYLVRLGGLEALAQTGAFTLVQPVGKGAILRASNRISDYGPAQVCEVRRALQPVLRQQATRFHPSKANLRVCWDTEGGDSPA